MNNAKVFQTNSNKSQKKNPICYLIRATNFSWLEIDADKIANQVQASHITAYFLITDSYNLLPKLVVLHSKNETYVIAKIKKLLSENENEVDKIKFGKSISLATFDSKRKFTAMQSVQQQQ